ncbi:L,D-transpeptidase [Marinospirillum insulare]|uniref:Peptidase n=1 Tax=Marinospirillum insulare TaxID=217169 RepID=A0ABQ5ZY95_9GAMM|nr:L,D-transpeptidase [Marinospirillum insulare]GLR64352.1 peptidase [Marinospirillum insulare]
MLTNRLPSAEWLRVDTANQVLHWLSAKNQILQSWPVATGLAGLGEQEGSGCTPRGWHRVRAKIGAGEDARAVFRGRRPTGETWSPELNEQFPNRDWILGRILWLCGEEVGFNRGGQVDTQRRFIYLHGVPATKPLGVAASAGCVNLHPEAMLEVFDLVPVGTKVLIE